MPRDGQTMFRIKDRGRALPRLMARERKYWLKLMETARTHLAALERAETAYLGALDETANEMATSESTQGHETTAQT